MNRKTVHLGILLFYNRIKRKGLHEKLTYIQEGSTESKSAAVTEHALYIGAF